MHIDQLLSRKIFSAQACPIPRSHVHVHILRYKKRSGELGEIMGDVALRTATTNLEDGFRLTVWAYDKQEVCLTIFVAVSITCSSPSNSLSQVVGQKAKLSQHIFIQSAPLLSSRQSSPEPQAPAVVKEVVAIHDYAAHYSDELNFSAGDRIQVTVESKLIRCGHSKRLGWSGFGPTTFSQTQLAHAHFELC